MYNPIANGLPEGYKDCLHTNIEIHLDCKDRLRVLFGAKMNLKCLTYCENIPGKVYSESEVNVWFPSRRKTPMCYEAEIKQDVLE